ncbi:four-carbon acid sugar kinase family protein [Photorhabdus heterorhabditis]|uniref:four-carbon acid sugar kinase family protein n=1 Tax=Photorhabdus heterorhabditis TaxID=880156 RepID=UPI0030DAE17E
MTIKLGVIADDFTGATDIASFMVQSGWRVVQLLVAPDENTVVPQNIDAIVISLKSRSFPVDEAVNNSLNTKILPLVTPRSRLSANILQILLNI